MGAPSLLLHRFCCLRSGLGVFMFVDPYVERAPPRREHFPCVDAGQKRSFSFSPLPAPFCLLLRVYLQREKLPRPGWRQKGLCFQKTPGWQSVPDGECLRCCSPRVAGRMEVPWRSYGGAGAPRISAEAFCISGMLSGSRRHRGRSANRTGTSPQPSPWLPETHVAPAEKSHGM